MFKNLEMTNYLALRKHNMSLTLKDHLGDGISFHKCGDFRSVKREDWDKVFLFRRLIIKLIQVMKKVCHRTGMKRDDRQTWSHQNTDDMGEQEWPWAWESCWAIAAWTEEHITITQNYRQATMYCLSSPTVGRPPRTPLFLSRLPTHVWVASVSILLWLHHTSITHT